MGEEPRGRAAMADQEGPARRQVEIPGTDDSPAKNRPTIPSDPAPTADGSALPPPPAMAESASPERNEPGADPYRESPSSGPIEPDLLPPDGDWFMAAPPGDVRVRVKKGEGLTGFMCPYKGKEGINDQDRMLQVGPEPNDKVSGRVRLLWRE
ncbi:hypothetical protein B296_00009998 [Ensete ventricosum]|uniref:Uncharacterized protein n=1 Tax=Ensete ventricosum TaxID=4639 RepID=A0A427BAE7_ENSVE|nr:hypothetical protein B296_00009998 [Ensete ventricosum]